MMTLRDQLGEVTVRGGDYFEVETAPGKVGKFSVVCERFREPGTYTDPVICGRLVAGCALSKGVLYAIKPDGTPTLGTFQLGNYPIQAIFYFKRDLVAKAVRAFRAKEAPAKADTLG